MRTLYPSIAYCSHQYQHSIMTCMNPAIPTISQTIADALGSQLEALFLFGSQTKNHYQTAVSDTNLLLVIQPNTNIQAVRRAFFPIWQSHHAVLKRAPIVATRHSLQHHLQLNPRLTIHLLQNGQPLAGNLSKKDLFYVPTNPYEIYAHYAEQLLDASAALCHTTANGAATNEQLNRLVRRILNQPNGFEESAVSQFNTVHQALTTVTSQLPAAKTWNVAAQTGVASTTIPGLLAIYTENNKNIFIFDQLPSQRVSQINWQRLAQRLPQANGTLHITTVAHFCLMALYNNALDLRFNKFAHKWGVHFLNQLTPTDYQILRQAARVPSHILLDALPHSFLTAVNSSDDTLHKLIHDYQNKMLNIQLENELLFRLGLISEKYIPPEPLPERDASPQKRLDAIFQHLEWWSDFYQTALQTKS